MSANQSLAYLLRRFAGCLQVQPGPLAGEAPSSEGGKGLNLGQITPPGSGVPILPPLVKGRTQEGWFVILESCPTIVERKKSLTYLLRRFAGCLQVNLAPLRGKQLAELESHA